MAKHIGAGYGGVEVFIESRREVHHLRDGRSLRAAEYMVPRRFHFKYRLPRNANGKLDRTADFKITDGKHD